MNLTFNLVLHYFKSRKFRNNELSELLPNTQPCYTPEKVLSLIGVRRVLDLCARTKSNTGHVHRVNVKTINNSNNIIHNNHKLGNNNKTSAKASAASTTRGTMAMMINIRETTTITTTLTTAPKHQLNHQQC